MTKKIATQLELNTVLSLRSPENEQGQEIVEKQRKILVATPKRLIVFMEFKQISVMKISYLVLDEAHQLLDMGLRAPRLARLWTISNVRDRPSVWQLAADFLDSYTKVNVVSKTLSANHQVTRIVDCFGEKQNWLTF